MDVMAQFVEFRFQNNPFVEDSEQGFDVVVHFEDLPYMPPTAVMGTIEQAFPAGWWCSLTGRKPFVCGSLEEAQNHAISEFAR